MKVTIIIEGVERTFEGDYYELHTGDWNERVRDFLNDVEDYNKCEVPGFEFVQDALDKLTIRK